MPDNTVKSVSFGDVDWISEFHKQQSVFISKNPKYKQKAHLVGKFHTVEVPEFPQVFCDILGILGAPDESAVFCPCPVDVPGRRQPALAVLVIVGRRDAEFKKSSPSSSFSFPLDAYSVNFVIRSGFLDHISCAISQSLLLHAKQELQQTNGRLTKIISNFQRNRQFSKYFRVWFDRTHNKERLLSNHSVTICTALAKLSDAVMAGTNKTASIVDILVAIFPNANVSYEEASIDLNSFVGSFALQPVIGSNQVYKTQENNLVGIVLSSTSVVSGSISVSSKDNSENVEILGALCHFLKSFGNLFRSRSVLELIHSLLPALFNGNSSSLSSASYSRIVSHIEEFGRCSCNLEVVDIKGEVQLYSSKSKSSPVDDPDVNQYLSVEQRADGETRYSSRRFEGSAVLFLSPSAGPPMALSELALVEDIVYAFLASIKNSELQRALQVERASVESMRQKLSAALSLVVLSIHLADAKNMEDLSLITKAKLPTVIGCKKCVLLIPASSSETNAVFKTPESKFESADESFEVSKTQLENIPLYGTENREKLNKIVLIHPANRTVMAIVLCFENIEMNWQGLTDILVSTLSSTLVNSMSKFEFLDTMKSVRAALQQLEGSQRENLQLQSTINDSNEVILKYGSQVELLNASIAQVQGKYERLLALITRFSYDRKTHTLPISDWLSSISKEMNATCLIIKREDGAVMIDHPESRDIVSAATQAIAGGIAVEATLDSGLRALLIPNMFVPQYIKTSQASFAILRKGSSSFSEDDKNYLQCAVNMFCKTLAISETVPFTIADYKTLEIDLRAKNSVIDRLHKAVSIMSSIYDVKSIQEITEILQSDGPLALKRSGTDKCSFSITSSYALDDIQDVLSFFKIGYASDVSLAIQKKIRAKKSYRHGSRLMYPIYIGNEALLGLLLIERHFELNDGSTEGPTVDDLLLNEDDESIVSIIARFVAGTIGCIRSLQGALGNIHVLSHLLLIYICKLHWNFKGASLTLAQPFKLCSIESRQ